MNYANDVFTRVYDHETTKQVDFLPEWHNGTHYFDKLVTKNLDLQPGELACTWTGDGNRRRVIVIATVFGNVVVFDRFTDNAQLAASVFTFNAPTIITQLGLLKSGALSGDDLLEVLGDPKYPVLYKNIGQRLSAIKEALDNPEKYVRGDRLAATA